MFSFHSFLIIFSGHFSDGLPDRLLFDKSVQIKQLNVVEQHGILLFRTGDKGKESNVYVYRLSELNGESNTTSIDYNSFEEDEDIAGSFSSNFTMTTNSNPSTSNRPTIIRTRSHIKERKLERTRGCQLYSITRPGGSHLRMVIMLLFFIQINSRIFYICTILRSTYFAHFCFS